MARIREKIVKGIPYYSIVTSVRVGPNRAPREKTLEYIGSFDRLKDYVLNAYSEKNGQGSQQTEDNTPPIHRTFKSYAHGACYAMYRMGHYLGIEKVFNEEFRKKTIKGLTRGEVLLLSMIHRAVDPGSMSDFVDWFKQSSLPYHLGLDPDLLTPQDIWEAMDGISEQEIERVQERFVTRLRELYSTDLSALHLDYTNYYTFIDSQNDRCTICRRGHNKQKRDDLRQFSLALITSQDMPLPMIWEIYEGNRNDKTEFDLFTDRVEAALKRLGCNPEDTTLAFDGGSNSQENFSKLHCHFVCAHTMKSQEYDSLYDIGLDQYEKVELTGGKSRLAYRIDHLSFSGVEGTGILTFSEALKEGQMEQLEKDKAKFAKRFQEVKDRLNHPRSGICQKLAKAKLEYYGIVQKIQAENDDIQKHNAEVEAAKNAGMKTGKRIRKLKPVPEWNEDQELQEIVRKECFGEGGNYLSAFIQIQMEKNSDGRWELNNHTDKEKENAFIEREYGKKLTVSDHTDWSTQRILSLYSGQQCIENLFRTSKNTDAFSVRPQFHWTDDKIRVHVMICMTALMVGEILRKRMSEAGIEMNKITLMEKLSTIRDGWMICNEKKVERIIEQMDEEQQKIWKVVELIPHDAKGTKKR